MAVKSKVELYAAIRRDFHAGMSGRALQRKYGVTWRTAQADRGDDRIDALS